VCQVIPAQTMLVKQVRRDAESIHGRLVCC